MAAPLSIAGLVLQVGAVLKRLHHHGKAVMGAQNYIMGNHGPQKRLVFIEDILEDMEAAQEDAGIRPAR
ncbi:hypothetical protein Tdes44962_MAKER08899 [Teratosphaeria destructans]|uniref:Uncharacterized protein n=1 Tax=Teratosphaeria destructans TaxID=418781 RepID=A0A9W7W3V4_9PEZI|nr:hypothetical protein Tdes44962_MAKER08899 [Teratosphaeria destructans]